VYPYLKEIKESVLEVIESEYSLSAIPT